MRVLVLGASGMLGHMVMRYLCATGAHDAVGAARRTDLHRHVPAAVADRLIACPDLGEPRNLEPLLAATAPDAIVNCVGVVKQLAQANDPLVAVPLNTLLPHQLARLTRGGTTRLVHLSTDCVFSGKRGGYTEQDAPDATDLYGLTKLLGEVDQPNAVTLRTSMVGRELGSRNGLVEWFLAQRGQVRGFTRAVFSGLTTYELARVIVDVVLARPALHGVYHVAGPPITKHDLLVLLAAHYGRAIEVAADDQLVLDRSLGAAKFQEAARYAAPGWATMVAEMDTLLGGGPAWMPGSAA